MPPGFAYPGRFRILGHASAGHGADPVHTAAFSDGIGRLKPEASVATLQAELAVLTERLPETDKVGGAIRITGEGLRDSIVGHLRPASLSWRPPRSCCSSLRCAM